MKIQIPHVEGCDLSESPTSIDVLKTTISVPPSATSVIKPDDTEATKESERQTWFETEVNKNMDTPNDLEKLFRFEFNYECQVVELGNHQSPQNVLNYEICRFIKEHDGPHNLLIVYYTGHGSLTGEEKDGRFGTISGKDGKYLPTAFWDDTEHHLLRSAESDVLAILDCCFASNAAKGGTNDLRTYELLAAAPKGEVTFTGKKSFTAALLASLKELLVQYKDGYFPTTKLLHKINTRRTQPASLLWDRLHKHERHVLLAPLDRKSVQEREKSFQKKGNENISITLRISLQDEELKQKTKSRGSPKGSVKPAEKRECVSVGLIG
ncbi:hypothetical protein GQ43DRAFT_433601 [Delitschia confertaspora ATCC 74209]|uniref:Peptidase C14 caspase domain-containing protein n=1 Tax=Delitschia confertaspora ATCC 74209 TaxID=1513339 RepID=A0A9P4MTM2_9PLEO|nr:hypothetical protein GQ43DRAFT_433601 [Delitschia confertaspora ATCC 74209]